MKKIILSMLIVFLVPSICNAHWAENQIDALSERGVLQEIFDIENVESILDRPITREEFFTLAAIANNTIKSEPNKNFADYDKVNIKYSLSIGGFINSGVIAGVPVDGKLYINPKKQITRQEATVILSKILGLTTDNYDSKFTDWNDIASWAKSYFAGVVKAGIINGYNDNTVKPLKNITVAEAITIIANSYNMGFFVNDVTVFAGTGETALINGEIKVSAFSLPTDIIVKNEKLYIADTGNNVIRCIDNKFVSTFAGSELGRNEYNEAIGSFKDGKDASFDNPTFMAALENGVLVTDKNNNIIRFINNEGYTTTYAGTLKAGFKDGNANKAQFNNPTGIAVDSKGNIYVADTGNNVIRKIDLDKNVTTFAGNSKRGYKDGNLLSASFNSPMGIEIINDIIYVADTGNQRIRMIKDGIVSTYAGNGAEKDDYNLEILGGFIDGSKSIAKFNYPTNIVADVNGNLYVADNGNGAIRKIDLLGNVTTIIKDTIKRPSGLAIKNGMLFISDTLLNRIFRIRL